MSETSTPSRRPRWPWLVLVGALAWIVVLRWPLWINSDTHLDSDLAVDGITLLDATRGEWRAHYPGTPHMGILPVLLSWPQAKLFGVNPRTLASGGIVAYALLIACAFLLAWRMLDARVACWSLVPLAFSSAGVIWLSGRITGGHLLTAVWHAGAVLCLFETLHRRSLGWSVLLGLWCGAGWHLDQLFLFSLIGIAAAALGFAARFGVTTRGGVGFVTFLSLMAVAMVLTWISRWEAHDAYEGQFGTILWRDEHMGRPGPLNWPRAAKLAGDHSSLLIKDCLPRLIAGHRLPNLEWEPRPSAFGLANRRAIAEQSAATWLLAAWSISLFAASFFALGRGLGASTRGRAFDAARASLAVSSLATLAGFVVNRNIFNSDNYRYLVLLLPAWAIGYGMLMEWLARRWSFGLITAATLSLGLAILTTYDAARWYQSYGWLDDRLRPKRVDPRDPGLDWLEAHPEVDRVFGGYWDVYRWSFLTAERVRGVPYPQYPNRFPEWWHGKGISRPRILMARNEQIDRFYKSQALAQGGRVLATRGDLVIIDWP